ncbi:hypothetical protein JRQ81_005588, partial [Phrynocephalus forsythii]
MSGSSRDPEEPPSSSTGDPRPLLGFPGGGGGGDQAAPSEEAEEEAAAAGAEQDWEAAKAAYESLTTTKRPRP